MKKMVTDYKKIAGVCLKKYAFQKYLWKLDYLQPHLHVLVFCSSVPLGWLITSFWGRPLPFFEGVPLPNDPFRYLELHR